MYRQLILDAAERVFAARGYDGTKMQDIATEAGISLGTVYASTSGKEEIFTAIHQARGRELLTLAAEAAQGCGSPVEAMMAGVRAYVEFLVQRPHYLRMHLNETQPWALTPNFISQEQRTQWRRGLELTVTVFRAGIADGSLIAGDPERMARLMIAAHQVFLVGWIEGEMRTPHGELIEAMQEHVRRAFVRQAGA